MLCKWNVPRQLNLPTATLAEMNLRKAGSMASGGDQPINKDLEFDPRHPDQRDTDLTALMALRYDLYMGHPRDNTKPCV